MRRIVFLGLLMMGFAGQSRATEVVSLLKDVVPGPGGSDPWVFRQGCYGVTYFSVTNGSEWQVWKTTGQPGAAEFVTGGFFYEPDPEDPPHSFVCMGGVTYFVARTAASGKELWRTDGTTAGTWMVRDIRPGSLSSTPTSLVVLNGALYFYAFTDASGSELWKSDGTSAGTVMVRDIAPGSASSLGGGRPMVVYGSRLYFAASTASAGRELWRSDGTSAGTVLIRDIAPGSASGDPAQFTVAGTTLYFAATTATAGQELWKTDGTAAGTVLVRDIRSGSTGSLPVLLGNLNGNLLLAANNGTVGSELWKSNGTSSGTVLVKDINTGSGSMGVALSAFAVVNGVAYFQAVTATAGGELWRSDGTSGGTYLVKDIRPGTAWSQPDYFAAMAGVLYFVADDGVHGRELWKSNGTGTGTILLADLVPGTASSMPRFLTHTRYVFGIDPPVTIDEEVYVSAVTSALGREPWVIRPAGASAANPPSAAAEVPISFGLDQNYPNPFNPSTTIRFTVPDAGQGAAVPTTLQVFDLLGRQVAELVNGDRAPGAHEVAFDASDLAGGAYLYRLTTGGLTATRKLMLVK